MSRMGFLVFVIALASPVGAKAQDWTSTATIGDDPALGSLLLQLPRTCEGNGPDDVLVCGKSKRPYRIDPGVLASIRAVDAQPPKPRVDAAMTAPCIGPNCGGATIPLIRMALTVAKAATLAMRGDDWREAFRTHPDQYEVYQEAKKSK